MAFAPAVAAGGGIGTGIAGALFASDFALALSLDSFDFDLDDPRIGGAGASTGAGTRWGRLITDVEDWGGGADVVVVIVVSMRTRLRVRTASHRLRPLFARSPFCPLRNEVKSRRCSLDFFVYSFVCMGAPTTY